MASVYGTALCVIVLCVVLCCVVTRGETITPTTRPNIVLIVADDLGWDDVSFHGSDESLTPNIDLLAYTGVALDRYYTHCVCTPSRAALLTGKYAYTTGMHGYPLTNGEDRGLPLTEKLLPEYLKELGYATHLVGKWHLGLSRTEYLPTSRGFDTHFGYRGGFVDYYEYVSEETGWDDVSFHGSDESLTPNIDLLAYTGVALDRYYTHCVCTPSRAALLTGKYAYTTGMHGYPLTNGEDRGLPLTEKLLPEYLKELGYATHLVGKWHLGLSRTEYLPTSRGFDTHFGYRGGFVDYYEYVSEETWLLRATSGMDLFRNLTPAWDVEGYLTNVFTNEAKTIIKDHDKSKPLFLMLSHLAPHSGNDGALLQAPPESVRAMRYIENPERRIFSAMMKKLDDSVGEVVRALSDNTMIQNTLVVIISDNGGMPIGISANFASNWPLRGSKFTPYEGGTRAAALFWTSSLQNANHLWKGYMHVVDWLPTILGAIGETPSFQIDGLNLWNDITSNKMSQRSEIFEIFSAGENSFSSITSGDFKLIVGNVTKEYSTQLGLDRQGLIHPSPSYHELIKKSDVYSVLNKIGNHFKLDDICLRDDIRINCEPKTSEELCYAGSPMGSICVFNITEDPCETQDLSKVYPEVTTRLAARLQAEMARSVYRPYPPYRDPRADPRLHNYTWTTWADRL